MTEECSNVQSDLVTYEISKQSPVHDTKQDLIESTSLNHLRIIIISKACIEVSTETERTKRVVMCMKRRQAILKMCIILKALHAVTNIVPKSSLVKPISLTLLQ